VGCPVRAIVRPLSPFPFGTYRIANLIDILIETLVDFRCSIVRLASARLPQKISNRILLSGEPCSARFLKRAPAFSLGGGGFKPPRKRRHPTGL
jgi:hypothetical protein